LTNAAKRSSPPGRVVRTANGNGATTADRYGEWALPATTEDAASEGFAICAARITLHVPTHHTFHERSFTMAVYTASPPGVLRSLIPARLDRLRWTPFHTRLVLALGVAWILDGLEITIASSVSGVLGQSDTLHMSSTAVGAVATVYLLGEVVGALFFGRLSDRLGRRKLFMVTLAVYLVGSGLTALTLGNSVGWVIFLYATRFIAGMGIGGEYAAINSAIDEMIPAHYRGRST
jgi:hypothetical protein